MSVPKVIADTPLDETVKGLMGNAVEILPWEAGKQRRVVEGDRYARGPEFLRYDPGYMLGREIHGATLGIVGLGRIGRQVAKRARGFGMVITYHNRNRRPEVEAALGARHLSFDELLSSSDYVVLTVP